MTALDALLEEQRQARANLLRRIDDLGSAALVTMAEASNMRRVSSHALHVRVDAIEEAQQILDAITEAVDRRTLTILQTRGA